MKPLVHLIEEIGRELTGKPIAPVRSDGGDGRQIPPARLAGPGRHGGVRASTWRIWDALGQVGGPAAGRRCSAARRGRSGPMTATAWSIPTPTKRTLRRSLDQGFRGIKIKGGDGDAANDERVVKGVRALLGPDIALMIDFNQSLDPAEATRRIERLAPYDLHWIEEPVPQENLLGARQSARDLADPDSGRRELVVSARLCRSDRSRRQRFHHARSDEVRRRHRLAARRGHRPRPRITSRCRATCLPKPAPTCWR